jgi:hypothetical protein
MDRGKVEAHLAALRAQRDGLAALLDFHHLLGQIDAYENVLREEPDAGQDTTGEGTEADTGEAKPGRRKR